MRKEFCLHLVTSQTSFEGYFNLGSLKEEAWIRNPFLFDLHSIEGKDPNKDDLLDLRARKLLQIKFNATSVGKFWCSQQIKFNATSVEKFWCSQQHSYKSLAKQAISTPIPFVTTYLSEAAFLALGSVKMKRRNRLDFQHDMRVALLKTQPQFSVLVQKTQQASHYIAPVHLYSCFSDCL